MNTIGPAGTKWWWVFGAINAIKRVSAKPSPSQSRSVKGDARAMATVAAAFRCGERFMPGPTKIARPPERDARAAMPHENSEVTMRLDAVRIEEHGRRDKGRRWRRVDQREQDPAKPNCGFHRETSIEERG